ncbi:MAG: NRDE family protein [bacterium]
MCTVIVFHRRFDEFPLAVAANRDELLSRPSQGWTVSGSVFAPRDLVHGGTWIGVNAKGLLVALTNRAGASRDPTKRSRGEIPDIALASGSAAEAGQLLLELQPADFNPFHAIVADQRTARVVWSDGRSLHSLILGPGVHVITESSFQGAPPPRAHRIERLLRSLQRFDPDVLTHVLSDRHPGGMDSPFVDLEEFAYGTRSSAILGLAEDRSLLWESATRPTPNSFVDRSAELHAIRVTSETSLRVPS